MRSLKRKGFRVTGGCIILTVVDGERCRTYCKSSSNFWVIIQQKMQRLFQPFVKRFITVRSNRLLMVQPLQVLMKTYGEGQMPKEHINNWYSWLLNSKGFSMTNIRDVMMRLNNMTKMIFSFSSTQLGAS